MLSLQTVIKIKAKEVYQAECQGKRFQDIDYSDEIIAKIYRKSASRVFLVINTLVKDYKEFTAEREHRVNTLMGLK